MMKRSVITKEHTNTWKNFIRNALAIGDTYIAKKNKVEAKKWYQEAADMEYAGEIEKRFHDEAVQKLGSLWGCV